MRRELEVEAVAPVRARGQALGLAADYLSLLKPRIAFFVLLAALTGALLAPSSLSAGVGFARAAAAALSVALVAGSSAAFNQILERDVDRLMHRTAARPLAAGRIPVRDAVLFAATAGLVGTVSLAAWFEPPAALLALATLVGYALVYTPLKRYSSLNTLVGAIPGAMPPLLGHLAVAGTPGTWGWLLFGVVFAWQFPHFLAIAWLYREDYRRAGMKMLPALDGSEGLAGRQALLYGLALLPISLSPALRGEAGPLYVAAAALAGLAYLGASAAFALRESRRTARATLFASLVYLPVLFAAALLDPAASSFLVALSS